MPDPKPTFTISELSTCADTPISTIKFYAREGVLPSGNRSAEHRAFYDESHVRRLRVIQALRLVGGLSMTAIREICALLDRDGGVSLGSVVAHVIDALGTRPDGAAAPEPEAMAALREVQRVLDAQGIRVRKSARAVGDLANALVRLRRVFGPDLSAEQFVPYLEAMRALAERDFEVHRGLVTDAASAAVGATFATVLWEPVLLLLRRIAYEHVAAMALDAADRRAPKTPKKRGA
jgi:DNA-binding transcriptional MerR regulator